MVHAFGECELDEELFQLRRRGKVVKIEPKVFNVLAYLLAHRQRVVSKDELLDAVWPGQVVSESVLPKCVATARRAVGDARARPKVIQTVHGRGYRFVAAVHPPAAAHAPEPAASAAPDQPVYQSPFVGRERAMERLRQGLDAAFSGHGRVVLLTGEPGIGKSRTAEEIVAVGRQRHGLVLVGRAYEGEGAPAFWPWIAILRACVRQLPAAALAADLGPGAADVAELLPELRQRLPAVPDPSSVPGEQARFRLFDSVTSFLCRIAQRQPLVIVLDDLHWTDEASLRLLRFFVGEIRASPVLAVATYRDVEVRRGHPLSDLLGALALEPICERVALRGFELADTRALIEGITAAAPRGDLVTAVHELSEGNPFFIHEMIRLLLSEGRLADPESAVALPLVLPQGVRDAIGRRLNGLSAACNGLLRCASVCGRDFNAALLAHVADVRLDGVLEHLAEAVGVRVIDEVRQVPPDYRFHHALIRQTLYEELSTPERVRLHRRVGEALEAAHAEDLEPHREAIAYHFFQAAAGGDVSRAVDACVRAAERAYRLLAYDESAYHYERALQACELQVARDDARRGELLLALGEARSASGARDRARAAFEQAAEIARRLQRLDLLARAAVGYRGPAEMGTPPENTTLALLEEALAVLGNDHPLLRARLLSRLVGTAPYANSMETRDQLSREALALAHRAGDAGALRDALSARLWACLGPDHVAARLAVAAELLALAQRQNDQQMALLAYDGQLGAYLLRGDMPAADRALAAYTRVAEQLRQPAYLFQATFCQGSRALARGDFETAERLFRAALERGRGTVPYAHFVFAGQMYPLLYLRGTADDPELSRIFFEEMLALPYSFEPAMRSALAFSLFLRGDVDAARREFDALAQRGFQALPRDEHWLVTVGSLANLAILFEDHARAALLYDLLAPYAELVFVHDLLRSIGTSVASALGSLAMLLGRYQLAATHYEKAMERETAMEAVPALLESKCGYARLLRLQNRRGNRTHAAALIREIKAEMAARGIRRMWQFAALEQGEAPP
jgi:DNA-binding winged helix-turn-helix (wHTH) protein/tetratricopeptide (TPR) repeat protein